MKRMGASVAPLLMVLALTGCASLQHGGDAPEAVGTWFSPPAEFPGICMTLEKSGQVQFEGGFTYFNPGRWAYNAAEAELHITLGGGKPFPLDVVKDQMTRNPGGLVRYDAAGRELVYSVTPLTQTIGLGGFVFFRKLPCAPAAKQP
jgi:hypothetical protein